MKRMRRGAALVDTAIAIGLIAMFGASLLVIANHLSLLPREDLHGLVQDISLNTLSTLLSSRYEDLEPVESAPWPTTHEDVDITYSIQTISSTLKEISVTVRAKRGELVIERTLTGLKSAADASAEITGPAIGSIDTVSGDDHIDLIIELDEPAQIFVQWGSSPTTLANSTVSETWSRQHVIRLTNLVQGQHYWYQLTARDASGNETTSEIQSSSTLDLSGTQILSLQVEPRALAPLGECNDHGCPATSTRIEAEFSHSVSGSLAILNDQHQTIRQWMFTNVLDLQETWDGRDEAGDIVDDGTYYVQITYGTSPAASAPVPIIVRSEPLGITNFRIADVGPHHFTVSWANNETAWGRVGVATTASGPYTWTPWSQHPSQRHLISVDGLESHTHYFVIAQVKDHAGLIGSSDVMSVTTAGNLRLYFDDEPSTLDAESWRLTYSVPDSSSHPTIVRATEPGFYPLRPGQTTVLATEQKQHGHGWYAPTLTHNNVEPGSWTIGYEIERISGTGIAHLCVVLWVREEEDRLLDLGAGCSEENIGSGQAKQVGAVQIRLPGMRFATTDRLFITLGVDVQSVTSGSLTFELAIGGSENAYVQSPYFHP